MTHTSAVLHASPDELASRQYLLDRLLTAEGAGHVVHDLPVRSDGRTVALASRPWRLDPIPYVLEAHEFAWLEAAAKERMAAAEAIIADLYGPRRLVTERIIPGSELWSSPRYRLSVVGDVRPKRWLTTYTVDVVRDVTGRWFAIQELTDAPSGLGYALLNRTVMQRAGVTSSVNAPVPLEPYLAAVRGALVDASDVQGPRVVSFTGGIDHPAYVEHSYLATQLGFNLIESADLVVRQRRVWLRTLAGLEPIDVLHRRLEDDRTDPLEVNATGSVGVPAVLLAEAAGNVALANAHGSGVLESPLLGPYWDSAADFLGCGRPRLPLCSPSVLPAHISGVDVTIGSTAERVGRFEGGETVYSPLVVRLHLVASDAGITVVPGGTGRVLADFDDPRLPTPCVSKDVWVVGNGRPVLLAAPAAPQVDLIASVPTRAADSLYWLGRAAERAEALARATRVAIVAGAEGDVALATAATQIVRAVSTGDLTPPDGPLDADASVRAAWDQLTYQIGAMLAEASSVREFLSTTTGRVLAEMSDVRSALQSGAPGTDELDALLLQLSAFSGLWNESVVRGPAWYFGDYARRYERAVTALATVALARHWSEAPDVDLMQVSRALEFVLAANDSLVAYRRRHRSTVEIDAVCALLLTDDRNPRAVAASLAALARDAREIGWDEGVEQLGSVVDRLADASDHDALVLLIAELHELAGALTSSRLAVPPDPAMMRMRQDPERAGEGQ